MSKQAPAPSPVTSSRWFVFGVTALLGAIFGAGAAIMIVKPRATAPAALPAATNPDPAAHRPAPELTAGQTPVQADRTLGNFYYDHGNWALAMRHYESAIRQGSDDADIRTDLGNVYRFAGRPDDALLQYTLAQRMNPNHEFSLFNQGGLYLEDLKQPAKAVEVWQEYLVRFPNGRSVAAARQLLAQVQGTPPPAAGAGPATAAPGTPAAVAPQPSSAESLILRQIEAARTKEARP
jgi:tetratricopeptide (TPR) repeat protein